MKFLFLITIVTIFCQCSQYDKQECDYLAISRMLINHIKENDVSEIREMMAFDDKDFWNERGTWGTIKKGTQKILDTISDINSINTKIQLNRYSKINYAIVTFVLSKSGTIENILEVSFLHPESPLGCKVEKFDYYILGSSNKIDLPPPTKR